MLKLLRPLGVFSLHAAAVVSTDGRGMLIVGAPGSGKSTLALGLLRRGWSYLTDDAVLLRQRPDEVEALACRHWNDEQGGRRTMTKYLGTMAVLALMFVAPQLLQAEERSCGTEGTVAQRIAQCDRTAAYQAYHWTLVTRTPGGNEIWRDDTTGFLWSDRAPETLSLRQARDFCATPAQGSDVMGRLPVDFVLPEIWEVRQAERHGLYQISPTSSRGWFWSSTLSDVGPLRLREAFIYNGASGGSGPYDLNSRFAVRCISRFARKS